MKHSALCCVLYLIASAAIDCSVAHAQRSGVAKEPDGSYRFSKASAKSLSRDHDPELSMAWQRASIPVEAGAFGGIGDLIGSLFGGGDVPEAESLEVVHGCRQADGAVLINVDDTVVLVTVVIDKRATEIKDFLPLTVDYQEKTYAAGRIPGGFFRREGRPSENEILTSRLIDRPIRPLFADGFGREVQIIATVKSLNPAVNPEVPAMIGASAALALSIPLIAVFGFT